MARIVIEATGEELSESARCARTRRELLAGLLTGEPLRGTESLVFDKTKQVHTFGMTYPLDVVFCDADGRVLHVSHNVAPHRITRWVLRARYAIEMRAGSVPPEVASGMRLLIDTT